MADKMVTVASYAQMFEAELALNLLEREGISGILGGDSASTTLFTGLVGQGVTLQVPEDQAQQAAGILAANAAEAALERDWEEKAESGQDVWVCSICGEPVSNRLSTCYSCATPRESIRASRSPQTTDVQTAPSTEVQPTPSLWPVIPPRPAAADSEAEEETPELAAGDDLARRALIASLLSLIVPILLPLAAYYVIRVLLYPHELSPAGRWRFYLALVLSTMTGLLWLGWLLRWLAVFI